MHSISKVAALSLVTAVLCSCSSISVVDTWRNPGVHPPRLQNVLVVSFTKVDSSRRIYEDMFVNELSRHGVTAAAGYTLISRDGKAEWSVLDGAMKKVAAQAVLTVQTIKLEQKNSVRPGSYLGNWSPEAFPTWNLQWYYCSMTNYGLPYVSTFDIATMQVNLFDAASGKLIWAATLKSFEPEDLTSVGKDLAEKIVESLVKEGLI